MTFSLSFQAPKALPLLYFSPYRNLPPFKPFQHNPSSRSCSVKSNKLSSNTPNSRDDTSHLEKTKLAIQLGAFFTFVGAELPALAITGENNHPQDLPSTLIQLGCILFVYLLVAPPIIMNWLRVRWYRRNLLEMYFQFMFVFLFFPGILLWAPFLNFRKFPRDPNMKYPWSVPEDHSKIKVGYRKYPYAEPEDYDV